MRRFLPRGLWRRVRPRRLIGSRSQLGAHPAFTRLWTASSISDVGTFVTTVALQVLVIRTLNGSAFDLGLVNAGRWVSYLLFGLLAGALVDRVRRRPVLIWTDLGRGVLLAAVPVLSLTSRLSIGLLVLLIGLFGLLSLLNDAASQSYLPRLVPRSLLTAANVRLQQSAAIGQSAGPLVGGVLVGALGAPLAIVVDALSYLVSGVLIARIESSEPRSAAARLSLRALRQEIAAGVRYVYQHPRLRPMALGGHAWFLVNGMLSTVYAAFALDVLRLPAFQLGVTLALTGVGGVVGTAASTLAGRRFGIGAVIVGSRALHAVAFAVIAVAPALSTGRGGAGGLWLTTATAGAGQLVFGFGLGLEGPLEMAYRQSITPDAMQGRMNTTMRSVNRAAVVVGAPLGGLVGDAIGYRATLALGVIGFTLVSLAIGMSRLRSASYRDLEDTDADIYDVTERTERAHAGEVDGIDDVTGFW